ncbi:ankyrin repeat domain-containing protein 13A-like isoform X1 [Oncorhynchus kisutch]|uniref:ankyrin repeat domain-containing protein 13A-like isoform X1 n=1 Tax=Oncorhynchus kisutch TaxID=8019 RepID=UPI0012DC4CF6|nr:ankyrin repeat domain-containing protein 13A-like isoform X1 [Oncorhynchus kisutch]
MISLVTFGYCLHIVQCVRRLKIQAAEPTGAAKSWVNNTFLCIPYLHLLTSKGPTACTTGKNDVEAVDPRGRTPLHLAVSLGHLESVRVLLRNGAEVTKENAKNWTVLQEAVSTGDPEMVQLVLQRRDYLKASTALGGVPELLSKIRESQDFYMEMKWEFTSWIPLVSRVCPSDVCRIWKSGASLRVDATLLGFENMTWIRGRRSYIFRGDDVCTELMEVNHDEQVVDTERFDISREIEDVTLDSMQPAEQEVAKRLTTPIVNTFLDTRDIAFERNKSGIWGWRSDKTEVVNGFEAKVFTVNNVNVVIRTRTEHLTDEEKARIKSERNVLESLLGTVEQQISAQGDLTLEYATANNPTAITPEEYFDPAFDLEDRDIGRPIELTIRTQKFKGTLWMSEEHPLSLVEQVTPIIDLMARTSTHFARLRDFVTLKFPPGFPVKIEIPLFHVLNARISFDSVNKCSTAEPLETPPSAATPEEEEEEVEEVREDGGCGEAAVPPLFQVCPSVFEVPSHYRHRGGGGSRHTPVSNHDEELLQYAIHQSLLESGGGAPGQEVTWEDANGDLTDPIISSQSDGYTKSIPGGVLVDLGDTTSSQASSGTSASSPDTDLRMAMELSARAQAEEERRRKEEEEELERILQLSLTEK